MTKRQRRKHLIRLLDRALDRAENMKGFSDRPAGPDYMDCEIRITPGQRSESQTLEHRSTAELAYFDLTKDQPRSA
jgi:hypothetical protein